MSEIGAVYQIEVTRAGGWLAGDHPAEATTLHVDAAWDFDVDGGTLVIDDEAYEYTTVTFPVDPDTGDDVDDEPATIELSTGLVEDLADGDVVLTFPYSETKTATVEPKGFGEAIYARVPHDLYDRLPEGTWGSPDEAPTVTLVPDGDGWKLDDVLGEAPVVDGGFIDRDTLPMPDGVEPVAPDESHTPVLSPLGPMVLRISVSPVENPSPVMYDFYVSPESPVVPSTATLLESTASSFTAIREWPDGTPLSAGEPVYCVVQTRSADQYGPVSAEGSGVPEQASGDDIEADAITANHISAGSVDGDKLSGTVILGSDITTAEEGERHGLSADAGHYSYGPDGDLVFSARGGEARFSGAVRAKTFEAESASWSGQSIGTPGSSTMMGTSLQPPVNPPTVEPFYETVTLDGGSVAGDNQDDRWGLVWQGGHWWVASSYSGPGEGAKQVTLLRFTGAGAFVDRWDTSIVWAYPGVRSLAGSGQYLFVLHQTFIFRFDVDALLSGAAIPYKWLFVYIDGTRVTEAQVAAGAAGHRGDAIVFAWKPRGAPCRFVLLSDSPGNVDGTSAPTGLNITPEAVLAGSAYDLGGPDKYVFAGPQQASVLDLSGNRLNDYTFRTPDTRGLAWRGDMSQFYGLAGPTRIRVHPGTLVGEGRDVDLHAGYRWQDWDGEQHYTALGARPAQTFYQRAGVRLRTASPVPGDGGPEDPNGAAFYIGRSEALSKMELQPVQPAPGAGEIVKVDLTDLALPSGNGDAANPPAAEGNFPQWTPYEHFSQAIIPGTTTPQVSLKGDGTAVLHGHVKPWASRQQPNAQSIPRQVSTTILWPAGLADPMGAITYNGDGTFTINHDGVYMISVQVGISNGQSSGYAGYNVFLNGTSVQGTRVYPTGSDFMLGLPALKFRLRSGDTFDTKVYANIVGGVSLLADSRLNWIEITRDSS